MWESEIFTQAWPEAEALFLVVFASAKSSVHMYVCTRKDDGETSSPEPGNSALTPQFTNIFCLGS